MAFFNRVTIIGLGLIGGSLGIVLRRKHVARQVIGYSRKAATLRAAKRCGAIDRGTTDLASAVRDAHVVILATPVDTIVPLGRRVARLMRPGSLLTDVGSTKQGIVRTLERVRPSAVAFVGAHPLAGSEQHGIHAARSDLFKESRCILTVTPKTNRHALRHVTRLWRSVGTRVLIMDPVRHDQVLAAASHVPHLMAFCLVTATPREALAIAPRSFLDATRVAKSDPDLWDDIFFSNRTALIDAIARFDRRWRTLRAQLIRGDRAAIRRFLIQAQSQRLHALENH